MPAATCDCAEHPMAPHMLGEPPCVQAPRCPDCFSVHCDGAVGGSCSKPAGTIANCRWCEGDGRVTAAPIHNGHEVEALRIRIVCPVCEGTGHDE